MPRSTGDLLIARVAVQHPNQLPRKVLRSYVEEHGSLAATARALRVERVTLREALTSLGLWADGAPAWLARS